MASGWMLSLLWVAVVLFVRSLQAPSCQEVRSSFQVLQPGAKWAPENAVPGSDLQVCTTKDLTCCSKKMEERYQVEARQAMENSLHFCSTELKFHIIQNAAVFQETFEAIIQHSRNFTNTMLRNQHRNNAKEISKVVGELFTDISLYILGSDLNINNMINDFFDSLFPIMYRQLIHSGFQDLSGTTGECLRMARKDVNVFGGYPNLIVTRVSKSLQTARVFLQALNLGIEVINTTDHLKFTKDCGRALLKMWYCPHCQGLLMAKPCLGYCSNVMQSCLSSVIDIQNHWKEYIRSLEALANSMQGTYDVEHVLLNLHSLIKNAVIYAQKNGGKLSTTIKKICGHTWRRHARSTFYPVGLYVDQKGIKHTYTEYEETLSKRRREFINKLKTYNNFYANLPHQMCSGDYAVQNNTICWNGQDIVERYTYPAIKNTAKAQTSSNSDAKGKGREPVVNQIIDKLKHINQLLKGITIPRLRTGNKDMGSTEGDALESGDCDDEDECGGSGNGGFKIQQQPWFSSELPDELFVDDIIFHKQLLTPQRGNEASTNSAAPRYALDYAMQRSLITFITSFLELHLLFH